MSTFFWEKSFRIVVDRGPGRRFDGRMNPIVLRTAAREYYINESFGAFNVSYRVLNKNTGLPWQGIKHPRAGWNCHAVHNYNTKAVELRDGVANYASDEVGHWPESLAGWTGVSNLFRTLEDAKAACV